MNRLSPSLRALSRGLATLALLLSLPVWASSNLIEDDFSGASATLNWDAIGSLNGTPGAWTACLTAGNNTGSIPACTGITDPVGSGALRLTSNSTDETGAIMSNFTFPSNEGVQVTFSTYTYGGNGYMNAKNIASGADGIGFYLFNGSEPADDLGAFGGSLGYSCSDQNSPYNGMAGAYLGMGIDEFGNFLNKTDNTNTGFGGPNPGEIGLRGYGNVNLAALQAVNPSATTSDVQTVCKNGGQYSYNVNGVTQTTTFPDYAMIPISSGAGNNPATLSASEPIFSQENTPNPTRAKATPITYKLIISPTGLLSLWYNYNNTGFTNIIDQQSISATNGPMPASFRFGFGASTGSGSNIHEITCFVASPASGAASAPVAPVSLQAGDLLYMLTSDLDPIAGHVDAYTASANGTASAVPNWDAGSLMTVSQRQADLYSTAANGVSTTHFTALDAAAFNLPAGGTTCVPNVQTIIDYTIDPSSVAAPAGCASYLGARESGWLLGEISSDDMASLLTPSGDPLDLALPGYVTYAQSESSRPTALLFTDNDGFLYSVNAQTGTLNWGWMPRSLVAQLQDYTLIPTDSPGLMDGGFAAVDAVDASGNWASYVVGIDDGGAGWYDLELTSTGGPSQIIALPALPAGSVYPQQQTPIVANVPVSVTSSSGTSSTQVQQFVDYIANTGSGSSATSTLYEFNVATGSINSTAITIGANKNIAAQVSSSLFYDSSSGEIYFGDASGDVYVMPVSGNTTSDVGNITYMGSTEDGLAVQQIGYENLNGEPYLWATSLTGITVFGIGSGGWQPLWASTGTTGYAYTISSSGTGSWVTSTAIQPLLPTGQTGTVEIPSASTMVNGILVVPTYVLPTASASQCGILGVGYYDFFNINDGSFPTDLIKTSGGQYQTGSELVGPGVPFTPNVSVTPSGLAMLGAGGGSSGSPPSPLEFSRHAIDTVVQWRER